MIYASVAINMASNAPPVVIPASANSIVVNPSQVFLISHNMSSIHPSLMNTAAWEPCVRVYPKCWERIWGDCCRLPGWKDDRGSFPEVCFCSLLHVTYNLNPLICVSLKYHRLHPEYIHTRIERLGVSYNLRILLILCDIVSGLLTYMEF